MKSSNATEIRRLKKELATLRKVMVGYINQIDSLNKLAAQQKQVIAEVTQKYNQASQQISNLSEEKKNLDKKVTLAAQLDATNIRIEPRNKRGKVAKKVKDVVKLAISFTIVKNITAENGERTIYIRITKPDNDVLTKSASNTFPYENRTLVYSIKKYIEYNGEEQNVNVFWDVEEFLYAGNYRVDIFVVTERQTEGERQIVRYARGEEIENTSFIRDEQGNEYYIPAIREMACEPNTDASQPYRLVYQKRIQ